MHGQTRRVRAAPDLVLGQLAQGEQGPLERRRIDGVQKVALVLGRVRGLQQLGAARAAAQPRVVAGGHPRRAEAVHIVEADPELDLPVAQHVGIRRAPRAVLPQEMLEYPIAVLGREADAVQRNIERRADLARVLKVVSRGAVSVVLFPVGHEKPLHVVTCLAQQERGDGGVDAAGYADDDGFGVGIGEGRRHASIIPVRPGRVGVRAVVGARSTGAREGRGGGQRGYISICRICDSCMLVCQTSSKKFKYRRTTAGSFISEIPSQRFAWSRYTSALSSAMMKAPALAGYSGLMARRSMQLVRRRARARNRLLSTIARDGSASSTRTLA